MRRRARGRKDRSALLIIDMINTLDFLFASFVGNIQFVARFGVAVMGALEQKGDVSQTVSRADRRALRYARNACLSSSRSASPRSALKCST